MSAALETATAPFASRAPRAPGGLGELWRLARADVFERMRQTSFLVSILVMVWLAHGMMPPATAGYRTFVINSVYRPAYGAAWVGGLSATLTSIYFLFVGFYLVKGSVERDRRTGVGQILAAARVRGLRYLFAKAISNLVVLLAMAAVVVVTALVMQQALGEDRRFDLLATLRPFVMVVLPAASFTAAAAVFFDCVPMLRGGLGNVAWFFLLGILMASAGLDKRDASPFADVMGGFTVSRVALAELHRAHPDVPISSQEMSMGVNVDPRWKKQHVLTYPLRSIPWDARSAASRLLWISLAAGIVAIANLCFDRFDRAAERSGGRFTKREERPVVAIVTAAAVRAPRSASELTVAPRASGFAAMLRAEVLLLLKGHSYGWYLGVLAALITGTFVPLKGAREFVLPIASLWPVLIWSALGQRERREGAAPVLFSSPRPLSRLLASSWLAGAVLALFVFAPVLVRLAIAGEGEFLLGAIAGACFIPALALASGVWTGSAKMFEVLYLMLWYVGPMHHVAAFDYTGVSIARPLATTLAEFAITSALLALAFIGRRRQLQN